MLTSDCELAERGFCVLRDVYETPVQAWEAADHVLRGTEQFGPLEVVADYTMPPPGVGQRDFQVLHFDFGIPLGRSAHIDVARYTVLYVDPAAPGSTAATRIVPLASLAVQRDWPDPRELATRLQRRMNDPDAAEGILARIVEAADETTELPDKMNETFRCGLEFDSIQAERRYFADHGIDIAEHRVVLQPGQCLIFDNLSCAHGRYGRRATGELHQRCLGYKDRSVSEQEAFLLYALSGFSPA